MQQTEATKQLILYVLFHTLILLRKLLFPTIIPLPPNNCQNTPLFHSCQLVSCQVDSCHFDSSVTLAVGTWRALEPTLVKCLYVVTLS